MAVEHRREIDDYLDALHAIMYSRDRDGRYLFVNAEFLRASEYTEAEILGQTNEELWPERALDYANNDLVVWTQQKPFTYQETGIVDGHERIYLVFKFPICKNEAMYACGALAVDITDSVEEMKEAMGLVGRLLSQLEQSQNMLRALQFLLPQ